VTVFRRVLGVLLPALAAAAAALCPPAVGPADAQILGQRLEEHGFREQPVLLNADEMVYDRDSEIVTARGNVEISQGQRLLLADRVSYSVRQDVVAASGNVSLLEPSGEVLFAEYLELDATLKSGFIEGVSVVLSDNSRFAANGARRYADERTEFAKAVYSPCRICPDGKSAPLWQIKAVKVVHDQREQTISYQDAVMEVFGVPVAYVPFFRHADPTVKRKTGLLPPVFGSSSELGQRVQVPYYVNIAPDKDFTFAPIFTTEEGAVLAGEYRQLTAYGPFEFSGSFTRVDERDDNNVRTGRTDTRGHIYGRGRFRLNDEWRTGFDLYRATDDTYLKRYDFDSEDTLQSDVYLEGMRGRSFANVAAYSFQGLRADDDSGTTPVILPIASYSYVTEPNDDGARWQLDAGLSSIYRSESTDTRRFSLAASWYRPHVGRYGELYSLTASVRGDAYWVDDFVDPSTGAPVADNEVTGRAIPLVAAEWRYPWIADGGWFSPVIEPIVQAVATPYGGNDGDIPNEDSLSLAFDDSNLFRLNRFPGYDRVETGPRINYGMRVAGFSGGGGYGDLLVGQVYRFKDDDTFAADTGLDDKASDYVAVLNLVPGQYLDLANRMRLDRDTLDVRSHEVYLRTGPRWLRLTLAYVDVTRAFVADELDSREEVLASAKLRLTPEAALIALSRRDLTNDRQIESRIGLEFENECLILTLAYRRDFTRDRDIEPSSSITFQVVLRNLG